MDVKLVFVVIGSMLIGISIGALITLYYIGRGMWH